jgi:hypothetical protein
MADYVRNFCEKQFIAVKLIISLISHQQAMGEHWDLPNTEIFQPKDVASDKN